MRLASSTRPTQHFLVLLVLLSIVQPPLLHCCDAYSTPPFGIGALLFKPRGIKLSPSEGDDELLTEAGKFFTESFWASKSGGTSSLTPFQSSSLERQQINEFKRRYGGRYSMDRRAELIVCNNGKGELMGCAGIEVDTISKSDGRGERFKAPLMSNLAVGRKFRRKGIAEDLVKAAEIMARKEWGYDECYLYVEKRNVPAVKLYKKLGYRTVWEDDKAKTLVPLESGKLSTAPTVILCMKKKLGGLSRWLPF